MLVQIPLSNSLPASSRMDFHLISESYTLTPNGWFTWLATKNFTQIVVYSPKTHINHTNHEKKSRLILQASPVTLWTLATLIGMRHPHAESSGHSLLLLEISSESTDFGALDSGWKQISTSSHYFGEKKLQIASKNCSLHISGKLFIVQLQQKQVSQKLDLPPTQQQWKVKVQIRNSPSPKM